MKKTYNIILNVTGFIILILAVFHIFFWEIFNWKETLACLNNDNRAILYICNILHILNFFAMLIITFFYKSELLNTKLGKFILIWFTIFWILRLGLEFVYWPSSPNYFVIAVCLFIGIVYALPILIKEKIIKI